MLKQLAIVHSQNSCRMKNAHSSVLSSPSVHKPHFKVLGVTLSFWILPSILLTFAQFGTKLTIQEYVINIIINLIFKFKNQVFNTSLFKIKIDTTLGEI